MSYNGDVKQYEVLEDQCQQQSTWLMMSVLAMVRIKVRARVVSRLSVSNYGEKVHYWLAAR